MNIVDMPAIRDLLKRGDARVEPIQFSSCFDEHVTRLPWEISGNRLDWSQIPNSTCIEWDECSDPEIKRFINRTTLANYKEVAVVFSAKQPALVCPYDFFSDNLDVFFFHFPGPAYFVGYLRGRAESGTQWDFLEIEVGGKICGMKRS